MDSPQFSPGTGVEPTSKVEISISCENLLDMDLLSRSDPMCVVYTQPWATGQWEELLRTEIVWDNLNPEFATKINIDYRFEEEQPLRLVVYDIDTPSHNLADHDFLGFAECTAGRIVSAGYNGLQLPLSQNLDAKYAVEQLRVGRTSRGTITLVSEEIIAMKEEITLQFMGRSMGSLLLSCTCFHLFYTISKINEAGKFLLVYKSHLGIGPNPEWSSLTLPMGTVCNGDKDRKLKIEFFREGLNGYHSSLGTVFATVNKLVAVASAGAESLRLVGSNQQLTSKRLIVVQCKLTPLYTFLDYIRGGTQIHCCFAVDMTGSNGDPSDPASLHSFGAAQLSPGGNPYEQAIQAVGDIIQDYDPTKSFASYGFGARVPPSFTVSHRFHLNLQSPSPICYGVNDVLGAYRNCIRQVQLYGPTNFAPIIRSVAAVALSTAGEGQHYYVLLMITDGIISDMEDTTEAIVNASTLPLSIIIVGVGGANFDAMDVLDGDTVRLSYQGKKASRDIVQFVPYRDAHHWLTSVAPAMASKYAAGYGSTTSASRVAKVKLAQEVLAEIPGQLTSFMKSRGIVPQGQ